MEIITWIGILVCVSQSAMFSGLNLAVFSLSRLRLEVEAADGTPAARRVLELRSDPNRILTTILWGNVSINVLLTLLSDSVLAGVSAFLFSTVVITLFGEIAPQAYFSRNALKMASLLTPALRFYQVLLYPVVRPSAWLLDVWLGGESIHYLPESHLKDVIRRHMEDKSSDINRTEAIGALNFLTIDDLPVISEGVPVDPASVVKIPFRKGLPEFPKIGKLPEDTFLQQITASGRRWVVLVDHEEQPRLMLDSDGFLRHILLFEDADPHRWCHRPVVISDRASPLGEAIIRLHLEPDPSDYVLDKDIILVWGEERRVITGADILCIGGRINHHCPPPVSCLSRTLRRRRDRRRHHFALDRPETGYHGRRYPGSALAWSGTTTQAGLTLASLTALCPVFRSSFFSIPEVVQSD